MTRMIAVVLAVFSTTVGALVAKTELQNDMQPDVVSKMLVTLENTWQAQAHAFTECKTTGADFNCKEAPQAFLTSCRKVGKVILSHGNMDDSKEYMNDICSSQHIGSTWHKSTCELLSNEFVSRMSVSADTNREKADMTTKEACDKLWPHFVEEQNSQNEKDEEVEEEHEKAEEEHDKDVMTKVEAVVLPVELHEKKQMSVKTTGKKPALAIQGGPAPRALLAHAARAAPKASQDLTKPMPLKAQEQGFSGKMVQHKDGKTVAKDWRKEYGADVKPEAKEKKEKKSASIQSMASVVVLLASAAFHFGQ